MSGAPLGVLLALSLTATPPTPKPTDPAPPDRELSFEAERFAREVIELANLVASKHVREPSVPDLLAAGLEELYETAGRRLPADVRQQLKDAQGQYGDLLRTVAEARLTLGRPAGLTRSLAFVTAASGFRRVTDPSTTLASSRNTSSASSDAEFGLGFELEGATGNRWLAYLLDARAALQTGAAEPPEPPIGPRWEVHRVVPGSPAARAGMRPGDFITHLNDDEVTAGSNADLFRTLVGNAYPDARAPGATIDASRPVVVKVRRPGTAGTLRVSLARTGYEPESIFGAYRRPDGRWDYMLDKEAKVGYIRLGAVENQAGQAFAQAVADLARDGATGLVLDLRWCPGGWVSPTHQILSTLLPDGLSLGTVKYRDPAYQGQGSPVSGSGVRWTSYPDLPVAVLVGPHTVGGGEMIAAALQDHGRAIVVGQRTFGKANVMHLFPVPAHGLSLRVSTGYSFRPNGKPRHRFPESTPFDDWGVKPDRGYELPMTKDLSAALGREAERQANRPAGEWASVPFDDPLNDPQKLLAVKWLKERTREK
jgi:C-terminal processing protease CtpA/Prc